MKRPLCVCACLLLACVALAAPVPESSLRDWGDPVNPDHDCKIRRAGGVLAIEMPGTDHDYDPGRERFNAPRFLREIEGDFDLQVRVQIECRHSDRSTVKGMPSFVSAGLLMLPPEMVGSICTRYEYGLAPKGIKADAFAVKPLAFERPVDKDSQKKTEADGYACVKGWVALDELKSGVKTQNGTLLIQQILGCGCKRCSLPNGAGPVYLRLERRKIAFKFFVSSDGANWSLAEGGMAGVPAKIKVGLGTYTSSTEPAKRPSRKCPSLALQACVGPTSLKR